MDSDTPIYNSRITKIYIEYLNKTYPEIDINAIIAHAGMTDDEIKDQAHWFSQNQVDRFQDAVSKETNNPDVAREAGRYAFATSDALGIAKYYMLGLLNLSSLYFLISKVYSVFSRAVTISAKKRGANQVEIVSIPLKGVVEKPYQCLNRIGSFESVAKLFTSSFANINHTECIHKNGQCCRYIVTWEKNKSYAWNKIKNYSLILTCLISVLSFTFLPTKDSIILCFMFSLLSSFFFIGAKHVENGELQKKAETQGSLAKDLLDEMAIRHNNAILIQEIGQAAASIFDIDLLIQAVMKSMQMHMDFDRGLVLLTNETKTKLTFKAGYGYIKEKEILLRQTEFNLENNESKGAFVLAFKNQEPFLINSVSEIENKLSRKSTQYAKELGAESIICVPIFYEKESLGILTVDNVKSKRPLTKSDLSVIMGVASQMAISIINALSFKKIEESEKKYRDLVENANSIIMRLDIHGNITFFNEFAQKFFMYSEVEIVGTSYQEILLKGQMGGKDNFQGLISSFNKDPDKQIISEDETTLKTGQKVWITWTNKPIFDESGYLKEILLIGNDITELKKAEIDKKDLEARLQRAEKMEAIGTLAGGVAHDLNNILSGIVSYPELILLDLPSDSKLRKPIATIQKAGERASAIVQDLLTLARRGVVARSSLNLNEIVTEYLNSPEHENLRLQYPNVKVQTNLQSNLFNILGSNIHLQKTIMNLVINAAEAIGDEGEIIISTENHYVDKNLNAYEQVKKGEYAMIIIKDNGIGIAHHDLNRIFEPFFTKKKMGRSGTGLGMAVVWGTIKDHNAFIDVKSVQGKGTTFSLFFPTTRQIDLKTENNASIEDYKGKGEKILIVDDLEEQRIIASSMLTKLGYITNSVPSGEEAIKYIKGNKVDLIVLDMILENGIDGLDTYKNILEISPHQKAIITSGYSESDRVKEAQKLGAIHYLRKPYSLEQLGKTIRNGLG
ncbi:MAG: response regulator [Desulfobacteraceae bacterium]|nr:response regulator [Desulfobacteraceae bacterium]MBU4053168.1 response regulator [Pseudomonadota bacterium]